MTHVEFQVEEPSMEALLQGLLPRLTGQCMTWRVINYRNKQRLLRELPSRLAAYGRRIVSEEIKICVVIDQDEQECLELKARLNNMAEAAGLVTKSRGGEGGMFHVVNRIVTRELEAWYFGDIEALRQVYPRVPRNLAQRRRYRNPDRMRQTWETLREELKRASYRGRFSKIGLAREMGTRMDLEHNRAKSFAVFVGGVIAMRGSGGRDIAGW